MLLVQHDQGRYLIAKTKMNPVDLGSNPLALDGILSLQDHAQVYRCRKAGLWGLSLS